MYECGQNNYLSIFISLCLVRLKLDRRPHFAHRCLKATEHEFTKAISGQQQRCDWIKINPLTPNDHYSGRTAPLTSKVAFYIFIQQIQVLNILNMVYTLRFFLFKTQFVS